MSTQLCLCSQWLNQGHLDFRGFIPDHQGLYVNQWLKNASKLSTETTLSLRTHSGLWCDSVWSGIFRNVLLSAWHGFLSFCVLFFLDGESHGPCCTVRLRGPAASEQWGQCRSADRRESPAGPGREQWRESPPTIHPLTAPRVSASGGPVRLLTNAGPMKLDVGLTNGLNKHEDAPWGLWMLAWLWSLVQELMVVKLHFMGFRRCCLNINTNQKTSRFTDVGTEAQKGWMSELWGMVLELSSRMWSCSYAVTTRTAQGKGGMSRSTLTHSPLAVLSLSHASTETTS